MGEDPKKHWTDRHITRDADTGQWICWDECGQFLAMRPTMEEARQELIEYAEWLNYNGNNVG